MNRPTTIKLSVVYIEFGISLLKDWQPPSTIVGHVTIDSDLDSIGILSNWKSVINHHFYLITKVPEVDLKDTRRVILIVGEDLVDSLWILCNSRCCCKEPTVTETSLSYPSGLNAIISEKTWSIKILLSWWVLHYKL
jgi:hypothetical protein